MKLLGPAGVLLAGAAIGYAGFVWKGAPGRWPLFAGGFGALIVGLASGKLPILLLLFGAASAAFVFEATHGRIRPENASGAVLSDLFLAGGMTIYQLQSTRWDFPMPGEWGDAAPLIAAAAGLRFAALVSSDGFDTTGAAGIGWWQAALLAWWAGPSALLVGAGLAITAVCVIQAERRTFVIAGGLACVLAGTGAGTLALAAVGLSASAFVLGERVVPVWALAALPLSLVSTIRPEQINWLGAAASGAGIVGIAVAVSMISTPGAWGGRLITGVALTSAIISTGHALQWWIYGLLGAGAMSILTAGPVDVPLSNLQAERLISVPVLPRGRWEVLIFTSWVVLGVVSLLALRLLVLGGRTGFL